MKKILLIIAALAALAACQLGPLNYGQIQDTYMLEDLAGRMAHDGLSIPLQIIYSIDRQQVDIFDPNFSGEYSCRSQRMKVERDKTVDNLWYFSSLSSDDRISVECAYLRLLPFTESGADPGFEVWEINGDFKYDEGNGYEALLQVNSPVIFTWKENRNTQGGYYEKFLVANGFGKFVTRRPNSTQNGYETLNEGTYSIKDSRAIPENQSRLSGALSLAPRR